MKIGKKKFWGWGPHPTPYPTLKNRNRPFGTLVTFDVNLIGIRARKLEIYSCKLATFYNALPLDFEKFKTWADRITGVKNTQHRNTFSTRFAS